MRAELGAPAPATSGEIVCALEGVTVRREGRLVLEDVSVALRAGEVTGLVGANGAGKTTLLRVIVGLLEPAEGRVRFPGAEREGTRPAIGYVPQTVLLDPDLPLRARDVVALGVDGHRLGIALSPAARRQRRARVEEMLAAVDARRFADARVGALSGGEQQRVLIAHALVARPRLLLLDEPLANLDLRAEQEVVELLGRIAREQGVSVLLSAHDINPLLSVMARLIYVAGGRAASGTTAEVVRSDVLSTLYGHHVDVLRVHERVIVVAGPHGQAGQVRGAEHGGAEAGISSL